MEIVVTEATKDVAGLRISVDIPVLSGDGMLARIIRKANERAFTIEMFDNDDNILGMVAVRYDEIDRLIKALKDVKKRKEMQK